MAVTERDLNEVRKLLARGANPSMICPDGWVRGECAPKDPNTGRSLLHHAAFIGDLEIFKSIVEAGGDVDKRRNKAWMPNGGVNGRGSTSLHAAVMYNREEIVKYLVDEIGVDINNAGE